MTDPWNLAIEDATRHGAATTTNAATMGATWATADDAVADEVVVATHDATYAAIEHTVYDAIVVATEKELENA